MAKRIAQVSRAAGSTPIGVSPVSFLTAVSREAPFRSVLCGALKVAYKLTPSAFRWAAYFDAIPYVHYAVGLARAAAFAALFGIRSFSAIELGVEIGRASCRERV